jgi:hypothetical protein
MARAGRILYPRNIHSSSRFRDDVESYHLDQSLLSSKDMYGIFFLSLTRATTESANKTEEQSNLIHNIDQTLKQAGIVHSIQRPRRRGRMDFCVMKDENTNFNHL